PNEHKMQRGRWNWQEAAKWVRKRMAQNRSVLARDTPRDLIDFVSKRSQTWTGFVESLGIRYPGVKKRRDWTKQKICEEITLLKKQGHAMNFCAINRSYVALIHQAWKYYGAWDRARAAARA